MSTHSDDLIDNAVHWIQVNNTEDITPNEIRSYVEAAYDNFDHNGNFVDFAKDFINENINAAPEWLDFENLPDIDELDTSTEIGAKWKGCKGIKETENDIYYCPSEGYCYFKCIEKYLELAKGISFKFDTTVLSPYKNSKMAYEKVISVKLVPKKEGETDTAYHKRAPAELYKIIPPTYRLLKGEGEKINLKRVNNNHSPKSTEPFRIGLIKIGRGEFHAILIKDWKKITQKNLRLEFVDQLNLTCDWIKLSRASTKEKTDRYAVIFDIETYVTKITRTIGCNKKEKGVSKREVSCDKLIPFALGYKVIRTDITDEEKNITMLKDAPTEIVMIDYTKPSDNDEQPIFDAFLEDLFAKHPYLAQESRVQFWAHNGNRFDNLFIKTSRNIKFLSEIKKGTSYKTLTCEYIPIVSRVDRNGVLNPNGGKRTKLVFKDTITFSLMPLKDIAKTLKCASKLDFEIAGWTKQKYIENVGQQDSALDWVKYLRQDVDTLAEVFIGLEKMYNHIGSSLTYNVGLPGVAFELMCKTIYNFTAKGYVPKDPSMVALIKAAMFGGRVIAFKRLFNASDLDGNPLCKHLYSEDGKKELMISLDANSLYPSAMALGAFPIGKPSLVEENEKQRILDFFKTYNGGKMAVPNVKEQPKIMHYILSIKFRIPNLPQTLVPVKCDDNGASMMYFPTNGVYEGTYNDADIREMLLDGYEILEIVNGIYWRESERLFTNLISELYNARAVEKKKGSALEYVYKIILNSMYGKLLETINSSSSFSLKEDVEPDANFERLPNGQIEITKKYINPYVKKPIYLGTYVTAYSRGIMNEYIRKLGIENVWYTDTDSLYTTMSAFKASGIKETSVLGGVKNDYGDNVYISEAIFLDQKRYFLQKVDETKSDEFKYPISSKYVGLNFKVFSKNVRAEFSHSDAALAGTGNEEKFVKMKVKKIYLDVLKNFDDYIFDVRDDPKTTIKRVSIIAEKWIRSNFGVGIQKDELSYAINPYKKGDFVDDEICGKQFVAKGYDSTVVAVELSTGDRWPKIAEIFADVKFTPGIIKTCDKKHNSRIFLESSLPVTNSNEKIKNMYIPVSKHVLDRDQSLTASYYMCTPPKINGVQGPPEIIYQEESLEPLSDTELAVIRMGIYEGKYVCLTVKDGDNFERKSKRYALKQGTGYDHKNIYQITEKGETGQYTGSKITHKYFNVSKYGPTTRRFLTEEEEMKTYPIVYLENANVMKNDPTESAKADYSTGTIIMMNKTSKKYPAKKKT